MMTEYDKKAWNDIDEEARRAGGYVCPPKDGIVENDIDWIAVREYRSKHNKTTLTPEEWAMFTLAEA